MSDVLEGWIRISNYGTWTISITEYAGEWTSWDGYLYLYLYNANGSKEKDLGYYNKTTGWFLNNSGLPPRQTLDPYNVVLINNTTQEEILRRGVIINKYNAQCPFYPLTTPLSTPTGLYADNITSDSATTHWTGDENASNYKVQYKAAGDTVWTETYTD